MAGPSDESLSERLAKLGLTGEVPTDRLSPATAALACFPMYMVANVHAWTADRQFRVPLLDIAGSEQVREAFAIGTEEARLELSADHRAVLGALLKDPRPADRIIYEYALETLGGLIEAATPDLALTLRTAVARMVVAVARAAGKGPLGSGPKVTAEERACIAQIAAALGLEQSEPAAAALRTLDDY